MRYFKTTILPLVLGVAVVGCGGNDSQAVATPANTNTTTAAAAPGGPAKQPTAKADPKQKKGKPHRP